MAFRMISDFATLAPAQQAAIHRAPDVAAAAVAVGAFAVLLFRYTGEQAFAVDMTPEGSRAPVSVRVDVASESTPEAIESQITSQLDPDAVGGARHVAIRWSSDDAMLALRVRLSDLSVDRRAAEQRGVLVAFDPIAQLTRHFHAAAAAFRSGAASVAGDIPLLDDVDRRLLLDTWSRSEIVPELAEPGVLHALFERRARELPDRIAVVHGDASLTYGALDARADRLARGLRARGIGPGSYVAFRLPRSIDVYVALLGVLKAGAAYVPLDPEYPLDRVEYILSDCGVAALLTVASLAPSGAPCPVIPLDADWDRVLPVPAPPPPPRRARPDDVAYVIYTSGSTGKPKGVAIEHTSAVHLVRAEQRLFGVRSDDRVFQGFSIAFDAAVEEVWLAFAAGATLVVGTKESMLGDLARHLTDAGVTIFSTVPTLLASIDDPLPTVRLLIVGGEACPQALADRFAHGRAMVNTYGPTEATVIATYAELTPGARVTIGRPIPNYRTYILDPRGRLVPPGVAGEICIGGVGLARGYVGKPELTAARFVENPFAGEWGAPPILYRSGDRGRYDAEGKIEFLGRIDDQVKLRGFRIELGEIEAALMATGELRSAVVILREDTPDQKELVAYVVPCDGVAVSEHALQARLRAELPPYMVPARIEVLATLPALTSGKVDKRSLPPPAPRAPATTPPGTEPRGPLEETIARAWAELFRVAHVPRDADFFVDLGGHSLLAAQVVSRLRRAPGLDGLSVLDLYEHPTVARLAARHGEVAAQAAPTLEDLASEETTLRIDARAHAAATGNVVACGAAQLVGLYAIFGVHSLHWLAPYLTYVALRQDGLVPAAALLAAAGVLVAVYPLLLLLAVVVKWTVIGRYEPGRYPLWGAYYFRFWLVDRVLAMAPTGFLAGTPLMNAYYRLLGARIGNNVHLASDNLGCFDVIAIGDDATVGGDADLSGYVVENGMLVIGPVSVGARCTIGARSVLADGATMEDDSALGELSMLPRGARVPAGERWSGSPARRTGEVDAGAAIAQPTPARRALFALVYAVSVLALPALAVVALLPGLAAMSLLDDAWGGWSLVAAPLVAVSFIVLLSLEIVLAKWLLVGRVKPGRYAIWSGFYLRKWIFDRTMDLSLDVLGSLYATLFLNPWYRLLGARVGKGAEISTASGGSPDLLDIGEGAFVADAVSIGAPRIERGWLDLEATRVGNRSFVGNSAVVPAGTAIGDDCLVGCLSIAPTGTHVATTNGASWFGSPAVALPTRQKTAAFSEAETYRPTPRLVAKRLAYESLRVTLPATFFVLFTCVLLRASMAIYTSVPFVALLAVFPLLYVAFAIGAAAGVVALKWALVGRYRPGEKPLFSPFVWRSELVTAMHENVADPLLVDPLQGTPFAAWFFRALGAKVGRRVYMGTTEMTEYDLISIGDDACLNGDCTLQTHLFEDRVMKMSNVVVGDRCTVGGDAVVLYDTNMEQGSRLGALSLLMKGESLPTFSRWEGIPARPAARGER